ncbi:hypothetical protein O0I10_003464 [Lichtheimia ornata]|uniref:CAP-Gly domain-containing protein n=1 Tax=Lichtheimia ornata TaxID=688661 RepID=A0AAD7VB00_9FUNG|nr:uncharacterized protein O0I10_003464 [Lichtheimia ornata]KAJ8660821.1 hypothetical protein O0I10_003464 [Lichtheimia ornata]
MFHTPPQTLQSVLRKLLEQPRHYVADVCFEYPQGKIYAHRAIILARAPQAFTNKYLSRLVLDATSCRAGVTLYSTPIVPYGIMEQLLRFWYTAEFSLPPSTEHKSSSAASSYPSSLSLTSTQSTLSSSLATDQFDLMERSEIIKSIQEHEHYLGVPLLALTSEDPMERLVADIRAMYEQHLAADVVVHIPNTTSTTNAGNETNNNMTHSFPIHRCILAAQSSYFYGMFCKDFSEATSPTVHLPGDIFSASAFRVILSYYYHINTTRLYLPRDQHHQISLARKKQMLRLLHDAFRGVDYMSPNETVCTAILDAMATLFRGQYKCVCNDCVALLPFMWWFADQYKTQHKACAALRSSLLTLYTDQPQSIVLLWPSKYFAVLLDYAPSYVNELESHIDIKKQTAVQWLEHLYMCLQRIRGSGNIRTSATTSNHPALPVIHRLMDSAVQMISNDFCFYCFEYPILLSYVDKVVAASAGRRIFPRQQSKHNAAADFMEFLLTRVVQQGMNDSNAGEIYQGIVRDLVGRLEAIDDHPALLDAKNESTAYLSKRWLEVKAHGGFSKLDRETLRKLSEDIDVPYRNLTKSIDSRIKHWFGSKRLSSTFTTNKKEMHRHSLSGAIGFTQSRLSFTGFGRHSHDTLPRTTTPAAHQSSIGRETPQLPPRQNENGSNFTLVASTTPVTSSPSPPLPTLPISPSSFMDALLPPEPIIDELSDCDTTRSSSATPVSRTTNNGTPKRESRLRFELPDIPPRSPPPTPSIVRTASMVSSRCAPDTHAGSPIAINKLRRRRRRRSASPDPASLSPIAKLGHWWRHSWLLHSNVDDMDNNDHEQEKQNEKPIEPVLGAKVELLRRPLPMRGTIRYIGEVHFALGTYVGVELEDRLGSNDGSVEGHRYFHTNTQRGTFCKIDDFKIISLPPQHS